VLHADHGSNALFDLPYERSVVGELPSIEDPVHTLQEPLAVRSVRKADVAWLIEERLPSPPGEVAESVLSPQSNALCMAPSGRLTVERDSMIARSDAARQAHALLRSSVLACRRRNPKEARTSCGGNGLEASRRTAPSTRVGPIIRIALLAPARSSVHESLDEFGKGAV
jgi:hypothetical protein